MRRRRNSTFTRTSVCSLVVLCATSAFAGVFVSAPGNGATVASPVHFVGVAQSPACPKGVAAVGIYTAPGQRAYVANGTNLDTYLNLNPGTYNTVVQEWDNCGWSSIQPVTITVASTAVAGNVFADLQQAGGWTGYALLPPSYEICANCAAGGPQLTWSASQGMASPSLSGSAMAFKIGGSMVYSDGLWNNHLIGDFSSRGLPDYSKTLAPSLHNFIYDVYFFVANAEVSQALEFDINQFVNGKSFIWGHECRITGGHQWDTWDNVNQRWVPSGIACNPVSNAWNHLTIQVQRTSDDHLLFKSITLNGVTSTFNRYDVPTSTTWYGITVNYQQDGNVWQQPYTVYLDKFNFTYY